MVGSLAQELNATRLYAPEAQANDATNINNNYTKKIYFITIYANKIMIVKHHNKLFLILSSLVIGLIIMIFLYRYYATFQSLLCDFRIIMFIIIIIVIDYAVIYIIIILYMFRVV